MISLCNVSYKIIAKVLAKPLLAKLIVTKQAGFITGRSPTNNIITVQEVAYSLEQDTTNPHTMLIKVDIEKAYDALEWKAILAILTRMGFLWTWINWVHACICSVKFAFLINGQLTDWISNTKVRQRDPLSPYLFILTSQILIAILNYALNIDFIHGFDFRLDINFNHLIFGGNLILITRVSRWVARNCNFCIDIYSKVTRQILNQSKSAIYFPSWLKKKKLTTSLKNILNFRLGSYPFTYLGILIAPKRLTIHQVKPMVS